MKLADLLSPPLRKVSMQIPSNCSGDCETGPPPIGSARPPQSGRPRFVPRAHWVGTLRPLLQDLGVAKHQCDTLLPNDSHVHQTGNARHVRQATFFVPDRTTTKSLVGLRWCARKIIQTWAPARLRCSVALSKVIADLLRGKARRRSGHRFFGPIGRENWTGRSSSWRSSDVYSRSGERAATLWFLVY